MNQTIRSTDLIGQWGGEEFILLLPFTGQAAAEVMVERLRCLLMAAITLDGQPVTESFGIAVYQPDDDQVSLLARADQALYAAKTAGRNRVMIAV
ncbi:GGDEF domain-containing protein [Chloroflexus sp.]|uniref:GGDEF domain-containing protein n=1 Tax=Chloroflexus sp. TaxID=1904827 RepID=UPI002ACE1645|nr:GGDEF domain-containing protein [Chloroflexus sp.]